MRNQRWLRRGVTMALVTALAAAPTAAFAQSDEAPTDEKRPTDRVTDRPVDVRPDDRPSDRFDEIKKRALNAIERRLETIARLERNIAGNEHVTDDHAGTLLRDLADAAEGLKELARKIEAAETPEELRPLVESIVVDYRIFTVVAPKVHEVLASDTLVWIGKRLDGFAERLGEWIARAKEAGFDVTKVERLLDEMNKLIDEGVRLADPVAEKVIDLQPEDWPEPAQELLRQGRTQLHDAAGNLRGAHQAGREIVKCLRELIGHDRPTDRPTTDRPVTDRPVTDSAVTDQG